MKELPSIIDWSSLKTVVPFTRQHVLRLEKVGKFPRRIKRGENRVGWLISEIDAWISARVAQRDHQSPANDITDTQGR